MTLNVSSAASTARTVLPGTTSTSCKGRVSAVNHTLHFDLPDLTSVPSPPTPSLHLHLPCSPPPPRGWCPPCEAQEVYRAPRSCADRRSLAGCQAQLAPPAACLRGSRWRAHSVRSAEQPSLHVHARFAQDLVAPAPLAPASSPRTASSRPFSRFLDLPRMNGWGWPCPPSSGLVLVRYEFPLPIRRCRKTCMGGSGGLVGGYEAACTARRCHHALCRIPLPDRLWQVPLPIPRSRWPLGWRPLISPLLVCWMSLSACVALIRSRSSA